MNDMRRNIPPNITLKDAITTTSSVNKHGEVSVNLRNYERLVENTEYRMRGELRPGWSADANKSMSGIEAVQARKDAFKKVLAEWGYYGDSAKEAVEHIFQVHLKQFKGNRVTIFRAMVLKDPIEKLNEDWKNYGVGEFWSFGRDGADQYVDLELASSATGISPTLQSDPNARLAILTGSVDFSDIDWMGTINANTQFGQAEKEVRVWNNAKIFVDKVEFYKVGQSARTEYQGEKGMMGATEKPWTDPDETPDETWEPKREYRALYTTRRNPPQGLGFVAAQYNFDMPLPLIDFEGTIEDLQSAGFNAEQTFNMSGGDSIKQIKSKDHPGFSAWMNENSTKVKFRVASEKTDEELLAFKRAIQDALGIKKNPADDEVPKKEELEGESLIAKLKKAKEHSDVGNYKEKKIILEALMKESPDDWVVDQPKGEDGSGNFPGIKHKSTNFQFHLPKNAIPDKVKVEGKEPTPTVEKETKESESEKSPKKDSDLTWGVYRQTCELFPTLPTHKSYRKKAILPQPINNGYPWTVLWSRPFTS